MTVSIENIIRRVFQFNREVVGVDVPEPTLMAPAEANWLRSALEEEGQELVEAVQIEDQVDACVDAAIFAIGGLARLGLSEAQACLCFNAVLTANFQKQAGKKEGREGAKDAIKPEGWEGPEEAIKRILSHG